MRVLMVGTGYVGLVTGSCLADVGHDVVCVDLNERKVEMLRDGRSPIFEPGLETLIRRNIGHDRLSFTTQLAEALPGAEIAFIAVGTPEGEDGSADLTYVKAVAESFGSLVNQDIVLVVKSTVPVGTCDLVEEIIEKKLKQRGVKHRVIVASNPEFLKEGDAIADFMRPDRIVVGLHDLTAETAFRELYRPFILDDQGKLLLMDRRSSELTKYGANAMLATRISFMNELSQLCENLGANVDKVRLGIGSDGRIGKKFLYAGPGYGGSCFPKDVAALLRTSEASGVELRVLKAVTEANHRQKDLSFEKIARYFGDLRGRRIAVWGLSFKPGTDDVRETPAFVIVGRLLEAGALVLAHDPEGTENFAKEFGDHPHLSYGEHAYDVLRGAEALVLVTEWSEYKRPNWDKVASLMASQRAIFDLRNQYEPWELMEKGFYYRCVGRPDSAVQSR